MAGRWPIHQLDVKNAFLNGDLSETVYMHQPPGFVDSRYPNHVCLLQRSLYGLKQAPRAWFQRFAGYATRAGFSPSRCDSSLFIYTQGSQVAYLLIYVDDIILTASSPVLLQQIVDSLHKEFDMTDLGALNYFLGISAVRHPTGLFLSQKKYARQLLERAHMVNCNPSRTPIDTDSKLGPDGVPVQDPTLYRSLAGGLQYLTFTRPDLSYAVQQVCLYMHDPREPHFAALKRILRYVQGTLELGLQLYASVTTSLVGYTDADWAGCPSTRSYCMFLGDNLLSWSAKRQHIISRSSAEAEYRGVTNVVAETAWICNLLRELHSPLLIATLVYCDNVSAVYMSANPVQHQRTKHIEIDIHFVRDMVKAGHVRVLHVPSRFQYADIFTKGLPSALFKDFSLQFERQRIDENIDGSGSVSLGEGGGDFLKERTTGNTNIRRCLRKVADGHFTATVKVLSSSGVAPYSKIDSVFGCIKSFPKGTSCGRDGLRAQHILDALCGEGSATATDLLKAITSVVNLWLTGRVSGGAEAILHSANRLLSEYHNDESIAMLIIDFSNAFNLVDISALLHEYIRSETIAKLLLYAWYLDDETIFGDSKEVARVLDIIKVSGSGLGLELNIKKIGLGQAALKAASYKVTKHKKA
ncbi:ribonuclease H-like domain-containing protein [Tanacetum coccineum]